MSLAETLDQLRDAGSKTDDELVSLSKRMLALLADYDKVGAASKAGALEVVSDALKELLDTDKSPDVILELMPALINLASGDDEIGLVRAAKLVQRGAIEHVGAIMAKFDGGCHPELMRRCVWALQHLCRHRQPTSGSSSSRRPSGAAPDGASWLGRVLDCGCLASVAALPTSCASERRVVTRVGFLIASVAQALDKLGKGEFRGSPLGAMAINVTSELSALVPPVLTALASPPISMPPEGHEVHEAATLALASLCVSSTVARQLADAGGIETLVAALNEGKSALAMRAHACAATQKLLEHGDTSVCAAVERAGLGAVCKAALGEEGTRDVLGATKEKAVRQALEKLTVSTQVNQFV